MEAVIIVIHLMVIMALIAVVLLQRSEGGALGIGGSNAFLTSRGQGNVLTRATTILGIAFFLTSVVLTVLTRLTPPPSSILNNVPTVSAPVVPITPTAPGTANAPPSSSAGTINLAPAPLVPGPGTATPGAATPPATAPTPAPAAPATPAPAAPAQ